MLTSLAAEPVQFCANPGYHILFPGTARCGGESHCGGQAELEILRGRHGPGGFPGPGGEFSHFSGTNSLELRLDGRFGSFRFDGRYLPSEQTAEADETGAER